MITLPSLILQREFDLRRFGLLVALATAINQMAYSFGPGLLGVARDAWATMRPTDLLALANGVRPWPCWRFGRGGLPDKTAQDALALRRRFRYSAPMSLIANSEELAAVCGRLARHPFVTVDTEFLRETTFWPKVCVIQLASADEAVAIDALAEGLDLAPFFALMADPNVVKVFHAARQDIEIMWNLATMIPAPLFDTQVAAMVCGYGDQVSYGDLVQSGLQGVARQVVALHRLVAPPAVGRAGRIRHRRRDLAARHLPLSSREAREVRPNRLARRRNVDADLAVDLRAEARKRLGTAQGSRPQAARSGCADGDRRLARARGADPRRAALARAQGRRDGRDRAGRAARRRRRSAICALFRAAWRSRAPAPKFWRRSSAGSRAIRRRCRSSNATGGRSATAPRSNCSRCCCDRSRRSTASPPR